MNELDPAATLSSSYSHSLCFQLIPLSSFGDVCTELISSCSFNPGGTGLSDANMHHQKQYANMDVRKTHLILHLSPCLSTWP